MLEVHQTLLGTYDNLTSLDIEYLGYQLVKRHSKEVVLNMDDKTLTNEINKIIRGNIYGFN